MTSSTDGASRPSNIALARSMSAAVNERPLTIGFGQHDYFSGRLRDVRLYRRALTPEDVAALSKRS